MAKQTAAEAAEERHVLENFCPEMRYTMRRSLLQRLLLKTPRPAMWEGRTYTIKSKHIGAGVYDVTGDFRGSL